MPFRKSEFGLLYKIDRNAAAAIIREAADQLGGWHAATIQRLAFVIDVSPSRLKDYLRTLRPPREETISRKSPAFGSIFGVGNLDKRNRPIEDATLESVRVAMKKSIKLALMGAHEEQRRISLSQLFEIDRKLLAKKISGAVDALGGWEVADHGRLARKLGTSRTRLKVYVSALREDGLLPRNPRDARP